MSLYHEERLLILTKTYPTPSKSYRETVCVAAINEQHQLRRLYPIVYRYLDGKQQFKKWQWINAKICKSSDKRPESYNLDNDSIKLDQVISVSNGWIERTTWIDHHIYDNFSDLEKSRIESGISLGFIQPKDFSLEIIPAKEKVWSSDQLIALKKEGLFDSNQSVSKPLVKKIPYDIYYRYSTTNDPNTYKHLVTDWEVGALFWRCQREYGEKWENFFRIKLEEEFSRKNLLFLMGTIHRFQYQWLIIGLVYPPQKSQQYPLFPMI